MEVMCLLTSILKSLFPNMGTSLGIWTFAMQTQDPNPFSYFMEIMSHTIQTFTVWTLGAFRSLRARDTCIPFKLLPFRHLMWRPVEIKDTLCEVALRPVYTVCWFVSCRLWKEYLMWVRTCHMHVSVFYVLCMKGILTLRLYFPSWSE